MKRLLKPAFGAWLFLAFLGPVWAQEVSFASAVEAKRILSANDSYMAGMSPFDRQARMQTDRAVSQAEFIAFYSSAAMEWPEDERVRISAAWKKIQPAVTRLGLPLPEKVYIIKTSGKEEADAAYTRANAIILPPAMLDTSDEELEKLLAHELFHVSTRANPGLARQLYETIGFHYCGEVQLPANVAARRISNPDTPQNDSCIRVKVDGQQVRAIPILLSASEKYDMARGGTFFDYLALAFLLVDTPAGSGTPQMLHDAHGLRVAGLKDLSGFFEQVGENTQYVIHPEEILADNFALLVIGERNVPSPQILANMKAVLARAAGAGKAGNTGSVASR